MAGDKITKHLIVDLKTGFAYGIKMDEDGNCKGVQPLNLLLENTSNEVVSKFGPTYIDGDQTDPMKQLPFGQTISAVEMTEEKKRKVFTLVWPSKEDFQNGVRPTVTAKDLPEDLIKAGFAPPTKTKKGEKGAGVDNEEELKEALKSIDAMIGLDKAKHDIKQNIAVARFNKMKEEMGLKTKPISRHMVFTGNPGTGKTTFAREVAKVYHALGFIDKPQVTEVKREDLVAGFIGQTALKTKEVIEKAKGGILFIDEAYALSRDAGPGSDSKDFGREAIDTLVAAMENMREDLIVIVAGYPEPMKRFIDANEGLKSRFMTYISFDDYDMPALGQILDVMLKDRGYTMEDDAREKAMQLLENERTRAMKDFGNGRTVRNLVEKAEKELALRLQAENKLGKNHGLTPEEMKKALTTITMADMAGVSLDGLGTKPEYVGIGLASAFKPTAGKPANDSKPPAPAVEAVPVAQKHFKM